MNLSNNFFALVLLLVCILSIARPLNAQQLDPTKPFNSAGHVSSQKSQFNELSLQSIVEQNSEKSVIVSGKLLKVGDKIRNYTLKRIKISSVILKSADKQIELSLFSDVVEKSK